VYFVRDKVVGVFVRFFVRRFMGLPGLILEANNG
jgi:hypothetical protein